MRKLFLFAVIAIFGLASCTDEQILDNPQTDGDGISFRTMVGKNPNFKAMELTNAAFQEFWVSAYRTSNDAPLTGLIGEILVPYINNLRVFKTDAALNTWSYGAGTNYYWPGVQKLNFFAHNAGATSVMPTTTNANTDSPCPWFDFTQTSTTLDQKDVVVAKNANEVYSLGRLPVALQFSHALCQINFSLQGAVPGPEFRIKKIRLIGANTVGKYTFLPDDVDPLVYVRRWSGQSTPQPITYFENTASPTYITNTLVSFGDGGVERLWRALCPCAFGRAAAAGGFGPRADPEAEGFAAGRAFERLGQENARTDAVGVDQAATAGWHHLHSGDP